MIDYINIKIGDKRYVQRNKFSKLILFNDDGSKLNFNSLDDLPKTEQKIINDALEMQKYPDNYFEYTDVPNIENAIMITNYINKNIKHVIIPEEINGKKVVALGSIVFEFNKKIESVYMPNTIINIGRSCFNGCSKLNKIHLSKNITFIRSGCFCNCKNLKNINLENITTISDNAFSDCKLLDNINLSNVHSIGPKAFNNCESLKKIHIPNLKLLGVSVFQNCFSLETAFLGNDLETIEKYCFMRCHCLKKITLPKNLKEINEYAFYSCVDLKSINFPEKLCSIGKKTFYNSGLEGEITFPKKVKKIDEYAFDATTINKINISKFTKHEDSSFPLSGLINLNIYDSKKPKIKNITTNKER